MSLSAIWRIFVMMYVAFMLFAMVLLNLVAYMWPETSNTNTNIMGLLVPMCAAAYVGQTHYTRTGAGLPGGLAWKAAVLCAVSAIAITMALLWLSVRLDLDPELTQLAADATQPGGGQIVAIVFAVAAVVLVLVIRGGFAVGARGAAKTAAKQAAKDARKG